MIALVKDDMRVAHWLPARPENWQHPESWQEVETDYEPDFTVEPSCYEYVSGTFVYHQPDPAPLEPYEVLTALFAAEPANLDVLPDEALARMAPYMQAWESGAAYRVGDLRAYLDVPYRCLQAHTSQATWNPADAPSLWAKVLIPDPSVIPEWEQPGSTNPYMKGDKVKHNGKVWESLIDNNVWEPGVYGWQEVS